MQEATFLGGPADGQIRNFPDPEPPATVNWMMPGNPPAPFVYHLHNGSADPEAPAWTYDGEPESV